MDKIYGDKSQAVLVSIIFYDTISLFPLFFIRQDGLNAIRFLSAFYSGLPKIGKVSDPEVSLDVEALLVAEARLMYPRREL